MWLQKCSRRAQYKTYSTVPKYGYVTKMRYFVRMAEKLTFRVKECSNYKSAIMILCMLAYTDHSPSSSLKYHGNSHTLWISRLCYDHSSVMGREVVSVCVYVQNHDGRLSGCMPS